MMTMNIANSECGLVTLDEAARILSCCRSTIYRMIDCGELAVTKLKNHKRISRQSITNYITTNTTEVGK